MKTITENQKRALTLFNKEIIEQGDMYAEGSSGEYVTTSELLGKLTSNGWNQKEAEGTIGSLTGSYINLELDGPNSPCLSHKGEYVYWLEYYKKDKS
jgi:hypothetical protein